MNLSTIDWIIVFGILGFWASVTVIIVYVVVSLATCRKPFSLDKLLNRGKYSLDQDTASDLDEVRGLKALIGGKEFSLSDKFISISVLVWGLGWFSVFAIGTVYNRYHPISNDVWVKFWYVFVWIWMIVGLIVTIWFAVGGLCDLKYMFKKLSETKRDFADDGMIIGNKDNNE